MLSIDRNKKETDANGIKIRSSSPSSKQGANYVLSEFQIATNPQAFKPRMSNMSRSYSNRSSIDDSQYIKNTKNIMQARMKKWDEESGNISNLRQHRNTAPDQPSGSKSVIVSKRTFENYPFSKPKKQLTPKNSESQKKE